MAPTLIGLVERDCLPGELPEPIGIGQQAGIGAGLIAAANDSFALDAQTSADWLQTA